MRGKDINLTVTAGVPHVRLVRVYDENGEAWPIENIGVVGRIWDMKMEGEVGEVKCGVTKDGEIEVVYPALGLGRYIFAIDGVSDDGGVERIIEGYIGYEEPSVKEIEDIGEYMYIVLDGERRQALFARNEAWRGLYHKTVEAMGGAMEAKEETMRQLEAAQAFIESFNEAISKAIYVDESGEWVVGEYHTGVRAVGRDGETPKIGVNGNWWAGNEDLGVKARGESGLTPYIGADGNWCIGEKNTGVLARGRDGVDGGSVRRILVDMVEDIPQSGETCTGGYYYYVALGGTRTVAIGWVRLSSGGGVFKVAGVKIEAGSVEEAVSKLWEVESVTNVYAEQDPTDELKINLTSLEAGVAGNRITLETDDSRVELSGAHLTGGQILNPTSWEMYAWLEGQGDIDGEWVKVGEVSDIATTKTFGYTKLSTDSEVVGGAPVGKDANYQLRVPIASAGVAGVSKISAGNNMQTGGRIGLTGENALLCEPADYGQYGAMGYSYSGVAEVPCIGEMSDGMAGIRWASTAYGGAVVLAENILDTRVTAVMTANDVRDYLQKNYLTTTETWTHAQVKSFVEVTLKGYYTKEQTLDKTGVQTAISDALANYHTKAESEAKMRDVSGQVVNEKLTAYYDKTSAEGRFVQQGLGNPSKLHVLSKSEFDQLAKREAGAIWFVKRNEQ